MLIGITVIGQAVNLVANRPIHSEARMARLSGSLPAGCTNDDLPPGWAANSERNFPQAGRCCRHPMADAVNYALGQWEDLKRLLFRWRGTDRQQRQRTGDETHGA
jgi:hypothetical protein